MLKKDPKKRREEVNRQALIKIQDIIRHTAYITEANWQKDEVLKPIKKSLCDFVGFVRKRKTAGWLGELNEFGIIQEFCEDKCLRRTKFSQCRRTNSVTWGLLS